MLFYWQCHKKMSESSSLAAMIHIRKGNYYEEIQAMSCAGGRPKPKHFKRTMLDDEVVAGGGESREAAPAAAAEAPGRCWQRSAAAAAAGRRR